MGCHFAQLFNVKMVTGEFLYKQGTLTPAEVERECRCLREKVIMT